MKPIYHILNGDVLRDQLGEDLDGEVIVVRECLVDGPVDADDLEKLYQLRAKFINDNYTPITIEDYRLKVVSEFLKILEIPDDAEINLWFEDDLFCQVNMWFVVHLLADCKADIYLVRPASHAPYSFGRLSRTELMDRLEHRLRLDHLDLQYGLWSHYQSGALDELKAVAINVQDDHPYIMKAVEAHIDRLPTGDAVVKPESILKEILQEIGAEDFGKIYEAFSQKAPIYGYGDVQVKRLLRELG